MIHLAATSRSIDVAWAAFDAATIRFHALYATAGAPGETSDDIAARRRAAEEALRLWDAWRALFLAEIHPAPSLSPLPGEPAAVPVPNGAGAAALPGE